MDRSSLTTGSTSSAPSGSVEMEKIDEIFYRYANQSSGVIERDGINLLCSELRLPHRDFSILMLAWKMQAQKRGYFTLEEWRRGLTAMKADTPLKLHRAIAGLSDELDAPSIFARIYSYAFTYSLTEQRQKTIDTETVCEMLDLILGRKYRPQVDALTQYLKIQTDYMMISLDQWMGFYRFCKGVQFPELSNYNPDQAWPLILDNFVEWMKSSKGL